MSKVQFAPVASGPRVVEHLNLNFPKVEAYETSGANHHDTWSEND